MSAAIALRGRFWSKVLVGAPNECWPWTGSKNERGYGFCRHEGRVRKAHRVAWKLVVAQATGPPPLGGGGFGSLLAAPPRRVTRTRRKSAV